MPFLAGQIVTADRLNMLQPRTYDAQITATITGPLATADVDGMSVTFDTYTDDAVLVGELVMDCRLLGAVTTIQSARFHLDGLGFGNFLVFRQSPGANGDIVTCSQTYRTTLGAAGTHTVNVVGTLPDADHQFNQYSTMTFTVYENV